MLGILLFGTLTTSSAIDVSLGRQLFVDDYLIASKQGVVRHWYHPIKHPDPVVWPADRAGRGVMENGADANLTCATDGGLWWDPTRRAYRLWYQANWLGHVCYAESADGRSWAFPDLGIVKGTNRIFERETLDSWCIVPDYAAANPYAEWKLHLSEPGGQTADRLWRSEDGIHFLSLGKAGVSGDRSTMYYDPFRGEWVFSLRDYRAKVGRSRRRFTSIAFGGEKCRWRWPGEKDANPALPLPDEWLVATNRPNWSLYSFNAVAYESLMLGVMEVLYNTPHDNADGERVGLPKQTALHFCFSRDGRTFVPRDEPDIAPCGWGSGAWDTGYLSAIGGICTVGERFLTFYYSGLRGDGTRLTHDNAWAKNGMYSNGAIGFATLRRDGFAGLVADGRGEVTTKPLVFSGGHLFVNANCRFGELVVEALEADGRPIAGFAATDCVPLVNTDSVKVEMHWRTANLAALAGHPIRFRFRLRCSTLYSFWASHETTGKSGGYVAAGGPDYPGLRDL